MNDFSKWIARVGLRPAQVAAALSLPRSAIHKYGLDGFWPMRDVAIRIRRFTGGEVTMDGLLADDVRPEETEEYRLAQEAIRMAQEKRKAKRNGKARSGKRKPVTNQGKPSPVQG